MIAIKSSLKNLLTKKTRTTIVTLAGNIGIISIGLVLAISAGMNSCIDTMEEDVLSNMPIIISHKQPEESDFQPPVETFGRDTGSDESTTIKNKKTIDMHENKYSEDYLGNGYKLKVLIENENGDIQELQDEGSSNSPLVALTGSTSLLSEIPENEELVLNQYDIISSKQEEFKYLKVSNQLALVIEKDNSLSERTLTALGYDSNNEIDYQDLLGKKLKIIDNNNYYQANVDNSHFGKKQVSNEMFDNGKEVGIVAIMKPTESSTSLINSDIVYSKALLDEMLATEETSEIVLSQKENNQMNILSPSNEKVENNVYTKNMQQFGGDTTATKISIYPTTFDDRKEVLGAINDYNNLVEDKFGPDSDDYQLYSIQYSDIATVVTDSMNVLINSVTLILIAFSGISLVVSSIMVDILTYVSVVERTKEIGIMRALGARKKDISRIFNAESSIIGLLSSSIGVGIALLSTIPMNKVIENTIGNEGFTNIIKRCIDICSRIYSIQN